MGEKAFLVRTNAGLYFVDSDKSVYRGRRPHNNQYAGKLIGLTFNRDKFAGEYENGELVLPFFPTELQFPSKEVEKFSELEKMIKLQSYLIIKSEEDTRISSLVMQYTPKKIRR